MINSKLRTGIYIATPLTFYAVLLQKFNFGGLRVQSAIKAANRTHIVAYNVSDGRVVWTVDEVIQLVAAESQTVGYLAWLVSGPVRESNLCRVNGVALQPMTVATTYSLWRAQDMGERKARGLSQTFQWKLYISLELALQNKILALHVFRLNILFLFLLVFLATNNKPHVDIQLGSVLSCMFACNLKCSLAIKQIRQIPSRQTLCNLSL